VLRKKYWQVRFANWKQVFCGDEHLNSHFKHKDKLKLYLTWLLLQVCCNSYEGHSDHPLLLLAVVVFKPAVNIKIISATHFIVGETKSNKF